MNLPKPPNKIRHWPRKAQRRWWRALMRRVGHYTFSWKGIEIRINGVVLEEVSEISWRPN